MERKEELTPRTGDRILKELKEEGLIPERDGEDECKKDMKKKPS